MGNNERLTPKQKAEELLKGPSRYFDDSKKWAKNAAKADVDGELRKKEADRNQFPPLRQLASRALHSIIDDHKEQ